MFNIKELFIKHINELYIDGFSWEIIDQSHTEYIVEWRNDPSNLVLFENQNILTIKSQEDFLRNYSKLNRIDLVLLKNNIPIGVFNIKNIDTKPEYGALIGDKGLRGKGIGYLAKLSILNYWFNIINQDLIFVTNKRSNIKVVCSNLKLGFKVNKIDEVFIELKLIKEDFNKVI